jgi:hypothetical protein
MAQEAPTHLSVSDDQLEQRRQALSKEFIWGNQNVALELQAVEAELGRRRRARVEEQRRERAAGRQAAWRNIREDESRREAEQRRREADERTRQGMELRNHAAQQARTARALDSVTARLVELMAAYVEREATMHVLAERLGEEAFPGRFLDGEAWLAGFLRARLHEVRTVALEMDLLEPQEHYRRPLSESTVARLRDLLDERGEHPARRS